MKSVIRFGMLVMLAVGAFTPAFGAQAQAQKPCFGLADADCQLFYGASTADNMAKLTSFVVDYSVTGKFTGDPKGDTNINISGNGPIGLDQTAIASMKNSTGSAMMTGLMGAVKGITLQDMFNIDVAAPTSPLKLTGEIRIVGGQYYYMSAEKTGGKWKVLDLATAMQANPSLGMLSMMGASGGSSATASASAMKDPKLQADAQALVKYVKASTADGPTLDGAATKQFTLEVDFNGLFNGPEMKQLMTDAAAASASSGSSSSSMGMAQMYMPMVSKLFSNSTLQLKYLVGSSDKLFHGLELVVNLKLDAATLNALQAMSSSSSPSTPVASDVNVNFDVKFTLSKIGQPVKVDPVPDAQKVGTATPQ